MELTEALLGFVLITVGASSAGLAVSYWRAGGPTLLSFGVFSLLYGVRLALSADPVAPLLNLTTRQVVSIVWLTTYWVPVPGIIYAERVLGGARPWLRRLWQGWIIFATGLTLYDLRMGAPGAAIDAYFIAVIFMMVVLIVHVARSQNAPTRDRRVRRVGAIVMFLFIIHDNLRGIGLLPWSVSLEGVGVTTFILTLGFVTARQFFSAQRELATIDYEMKTARSIQESILPHEVPTVDGLDVAVRYLPMGSVAGDLYDFHVSDEGRVGLLVADVTGHGVPAALIASMAKMAFTSHAASEDPGDVLAGMNRALSGYVESRFLTATYVSVDTRKLLLRYSGAGHPPPLLWRRATGAIIELDGEGMLMGFDPEAPYRTMEVSIEHGDRLVLYTDGIPETTDLRGNFFGVDGLKSFVAKNGQLSVEPFLDALLGHLLEWSGRGTEEAPLEDDLTVVIADIR